MKSKRILIAAALIALIAAGTVLAMDYHRSWHHRPASGLFGPEVVEQLHLDAAQTQSLNVIKSERKALFSQFRDQRQNMMTALDNALKSQTPDLRALMQQRDALMDQMHDKMRKIQNDELNLYDSFTPQQKTVVRNSLLKRMSFMKNHRMKNHRDWKRQKSEPPMPSTGSGPGI
jgi:Spy/CpxP family protein refolding chaperone